MHGREGRDREGYGPFANTWCVNNMLKMVIHTYTQYIRTYMHARTHARMQAGRQARTHTCDWILLNFFVANSYSFRGTLG